MSDNNINTNANQSEDNERGRKHYTGNAKTDMAMGKDLDCLGIGGDMYMGTTGPFPKRDTHPEEYTDESSSSKNNVNNKTQ
ncbi:hypothetical protein ABK040_006590 [Willaertia magna]